MCCSSERKGFIDLGFERAHGRTRLTRRRYSWPFSVGREFRDRSRPGRATVVVQTVSGGVNAGDATEAVYRVSGGAEARVTSQGAVAVHRSDGRKAVEDVRLEVGSGARLEYLAEPRILFPRARYHQRLEVDVADGGIALVLDSMVSVAGNSGTRFAEYSSDVAISSAGRLLARDRAFIDDWSVLPPAVARMTAYGQLILADPSGLVGAALLPALSALEGCAAASPLPNDAGISFRVAAADGTQLRQALVAAVRVVQGICADPAGDGCPAHADLLSPAAGRDGARATPSRKTTSPGATVARTRLPKVRPS